MRALATLSACALLLACAPAPDMRPEEGSASAPQAEATAPLAATEPDLEAPEARACERDEACRVMQPSDWAARVECCYEYPCVLDYVAINEATWERVRAWRAENPFDCAAHLQSEGPCATRTERCGLDQTPPPAACREGECVVDWPLDGPQPDPQAQECSTRRDCIAYRATAASYATRCCGQDCRSRWTAVTARTRAELELWASQHAPSCEGWPGAQACPDEGECAPVVPPPIACRDGKCVVEGGE